MTHKHIHKIQRHLEKLRVVERRHYHPLLHKIHKKHKIAKRTLFYVKEYGPHSNIPRTIIKESLKILFLASLISSIGGFTLEEIKGIFISITPLVILLPALNTMIGNYGIVISSKFSTMLHEHKGKWSVTKSLRKLLLQLLIIALCTASLASILALGISTFSDPLLNQKIAVKVFFISVIDTFAIIGFLLFIAIGAGIYLWRKKEDPNNFLIPITTSIADFGNMILLAVLVRIFF